MEKTDVQIEVQSWIVPSDSEPGRFYRVHRWGRYWGCECPNHTFRHPLVCKHIKRVQNLMIDEAILASKKIEVEA